MADCDVCIYADYADGPAEVFIERMVRAAKPYRCCECNRAIAKGEAHQFCKMLYGGEWSTYRTCAVCAEIRKAFYCEGEIVGNFWEDFRESDGWRGFTTGCLSKLQTAAAKEYMVEQWRLWKFAAS